MNPKVKINASILVIFIVMGGLFLFGKVGFNILSGMRAYVGGEGLWAKGQKEATYQLTQYIFTKDEKRYQAFEQSLIVPLGDKTARLELEKSNPVYETIFQGFVEGGNHPEDIPTMIFLYKNFKNFKHIQEAIRQWEKGDKLIEDLLVIGENLHTNISNNNMDEIQAAQALVLIDGLQVKLTEAEFLFSLNMTKAARWAGGLLLGFMLIFTIIGSCLCFLVVRFITGIASDLNSKNIQLEHKVEKEKSIKRELKDSEERFRRLAENAVDMIYRMSLPDGKYQYVSPASQKIFGYPPKVFYSSPLLIKEAIHPDWHDYFTKQWNNLLKGKIPSFYEYQIVHSSGEERWLNQRNVLVKDNSGNPIAIEGIVTDITDQKIAESELLKIKKLKSVGVLAGGIAHDFNNILAAILGNINLALFDKQLSTSTKRLLADAEKASIRAKLLTQQLLTFSKGGEPVKETSSLEDVIKDSSGFVLSGDKVACQYDIPDDLWLVDIDQGQISQVIQNIVLNASHAMPKGGIIKISCKNVSSIPTKTLNQNRNGRFVKIRIQDSGVGIPENVIEMIFDPYFSTKSEGSGLGLAITQSIIDKHKGEISVESSSGEGSIFTIYLPAADKVKTPGETIIGGDKASSQAKILIMDDEEMVRNVAKAMLTQTGHEVTTVVDGEGAINEYKGSLGSGKPFDIVIMDLTIPGGMGGEEAVLEILKIDPKAKVIVSSGYSNNPIMANHKDYGFRGAIAKPFQLQELASLINRTLC